MEDGGVTVIVVPSGERPSRTIELSRRGVRRLATLAVLLLVGLGALLGSWTYLAARAWRAAQLEEEVVALRADRERVVALSETLAEVEAGYERLRALFGPEVRPEASDTWLPPPTGRPTPGAQEGEGEEVLPTAWPLTQRGFITQALVEGAGGDHPGIDIAVPAGSYIRAAGAGRVLEAAEDRVYGFYVLVDHGDGYRSLYGHASELLVQPGDAVARGEVIGLTGSTGRSTAPHLHFEILRGGDPVDPLTLLRLP